MRRADGAPAETMACWHDEPLTPTQQAAIFARVLRRTRRADRLAAAIRLAACAVTVWLLLQLALRP